MKLESFARWILLSLVCICAIFVSINIIGVIKNLSHIDLNPTQKEQQIFPLKDTENSISNVLFRLSLSPSSPQQKRYVGIIIENHEDARPFQVGLDRAVVIEEFLVEGFISRFLAIFKENDLPYKVGPIRSLRPYFVDSTIPWVDMLLYAGGSPQALEKINTQTDVIHYNGLALEKEFVRNELIAEPHNLFISKTAIQYLFDRDSTQKENRSAQTLKNVFNTDHQPATRTLTTSHKIFINFFNPLHNVEYTYDLLSNSYIRKNGQEISSAQPKNILILEAPVKSIGEYGRLNIPLTGSGRAVFFKSGVVQHAHWKKSSDTESFVFTDTGGSSLVFNDGQTWITVLDTLEKVRWE
jgi:hypothetical protein